jgi:hypothetical protein
LEGLENPVQQRVFGRQETVGRVQRLSEVLEILAGRIGVELLDALVRRAVEAIVVQGDEPSLAPVEEARWLVVPALGSPI